METFQAKEKIIPVLRERGWAMIDDIIEDLQYALTFYEVKTALESLKREGRVRSKTFRGGSPFNVSLETWYKLQ